MLMEKKVNNYTISKLAKDAGVSTDVIRYYEVKGIIAPAGKMACGYKIYNEEALIRMQLVQAGKAAGVSLGNLVQFILTLDSTCISTSNNEITRLKQIIDDRKNEVACFKKYMQNYIKTHT